MLRICFIACTASFSRLRCNLHKSLVQVVLVCFVVVSIVRSSAGSRQSAKKRGKGGERAKRGTAGVKSSINFYPSFDMFGKLRPFSITLDTSKQKKSRDPGPSTMPEAPTIPIPPGKGEYPSCCTICTRRFYHDLALLQLPEDVEKATLSNFHGAYDVHAAQPAKGSNSKQEAFRFRSAPPSKKRYEQKERSSETGQTLTSYDKNMIKSVGLSWWRVDQVVKKIPTPGGSGWSVHFAVLTAGLYG